MSEIERQIAGAEARWAQTEDSREVVEHQLDNLQQGKAVDWRRMDAPSRVQRRLERLGMTEEAETLVDTAARDFDAFERVLGANQLTGIEFFERGLIASRAVARIEIRGLDGRLSGYGSGVLISPRLILTNNHVLENREQARSSIAQFEYLTSASGAAREPLPFALKPDEFFVTDAALDFTVSAVEDRNADGNELVHRGWCPLIPGSGKALVGERVNIIQHPGGERMQVTVRENTIVAVVEDFLQYEADTRPGSSGSPVFNEQWEMAALHHAGVPRRDPQGRILMRNGNPWTGRREDVDRIDWVANEGVRISRIVAHVNAKPMTIDQRRRWDEAFAPPRPLDIWDLFGGRGLEALAEEAGGHDGPFMRQEGDTTSWYFRVSFGPAGATQPGARSEGGSRRDGPPARAAKPPEPEPGDVDLRNTARTIVDRFRHEGPYYDEEDDRRAREAYWDGIDWDAPADPLFAALNQRLTATHTRQHSYAKARHQFLYPAIDLHSDGKLRNIYSGTTLDPEEAIARELAAVAPRAEVRGFEMAGAGLEALIEEDDVWDELEDEAGIPFNCEHVVCQSWFDKRNPMRADLHHLFACDPGCNSFRSNIPYWQFPPEAEAERSLCGRREGNKFEPERGKGAATRATLYFLVRYPGEVGNDRRELTKSRLDVLLDWHRAHPVDDYERHRNWLTERAQGNRNPFVDRPSAAGEALLRLGFG